MPKLKIAICIPVYGNPEAMFMQSLMAAAEHGHAEIVEMLLKAGANVSITDKRGETATSLAQKTLAKQQAIVEKQQAMLSKLQSHSK